MSIGLPTTMLLLVIFGSVMIGLKMSGKLTGTELIITGVFFFLLGMTEVGDLIGGILNEINLGSVFK